MKNIAKSVATIGQVLNLLVGTKFSTPISVVTENNPFIALY